MADLSSIEPLDISEENELDRKLLALNIGSKHFEYIRTKGKQIIDDPELLSLKLGISIEQASGVLEALGLSRNECLSKQEISSIDTCLKNHPQIQSAKKIAKFCEIDEELVAEYLESRPLSDSQKDIISELFNKGTSINDIAYQLKLSSNRKIQEFVDNKFITFHGAEGQIILEIIQRQKNIGVQTSSKLREMIKSRNLKLQNTLCYILKTNDEQEYELVRKYFEKFDESRKFFEFDTNLSIQDILIIRDSGLNIEQLSIKLNKVESVIREYLVQYSPNQKERDYYANCQKKKIEDLVINFGKETKTFRTYRTIVTESFDTMIERTGGVGPADTRETFNQLLPLVFYYLKCSLSLTTITRIIAKACSIAITSYDIFHMTFQLSDPVVRSLCIEHYSFSNPVPLYYPRIKTELLKGGKIELGLCTELWYCLQEYRGLVSFGIGQASWNPIGKSHLLDLIFEADFVEGNPQNSAFHLQSIDIQLTRNLFGKLNAKSTETEETTKWAYIDCHRYSDPKVIRIICQHLDIALIHISYSDYKENYSIIEEKIEHFETCFAYLYVFIRDCDGTAATITQNYTNNTEEKDYNTKKKTFIFLPNLTKKDIVVHPTLKKIGYEILHLKNPKLIGTEFIESLMSALRSPNLSEIQTDKKIIQTIIDYIKKHPMSIREVDFSFLSYYPSFVKYMRSYYKACFETDYKATEALNTSCVNFKEFLEKSKMGDIALSFNYILERDHSGLLLWKLSQELSALTNQVSKRNPNDKYSIEILWREALLSSKYGNNSTDSYTQKFAKNFSSHVERGEAFELIDGDNLRFFNNDINALLRQLYKKQYDELSIINKGKKVCMMQPPIVVSIFGRQSSGKSTLLNYCFGCKFLTSAGRCTRGIYGSLARLSKPINLTNQFLILDTEGLNAGSKREISDINFDRTMVLFCLAVSQVVIINIKGELGEDMQNMLQICAHSLLKLKVSKVVAPKIFFVLNQVADPDTNKHLDAMDTLLDKLSEESDLMELEGAKISDLIKVSRDNLFILPSAFNCVPMNMPASKLFDSEVNRLSPSVAFANKCAELRQSIINQLIEMPPDERATFKSMKDWLEMSGVIWESIIRYQDIVKYRNVDELMSYNYLRMVVSDLLQKHIFHHKKEFDNIIEQLIREVKEITKLQSQTIILEEKMLKFDETYNVHHERSLIEIKNICQEDQLLKKTNHVCEEMRSNLVRLIYIERKNYKDRLKYQIKAVLTEIKLSENMGKFQDKISTNIDKYLDKSKEEQTEAFEEIWKECFGDNEGEEENERVDYFDDLYTIFKMESKTMENKGTIQDCIHKTNFDMDEAIQLIRTEIQQSFEGNSITEDFVYPCMRNNIPIKEMAPFTGEDRYEYLGQDTLYKVDNSSINPLFTSAVISLISEWVPECCHSLVNYCSGYYNHADITWKLEEREQIMQLASVLKDPNNTGESTWKKLIDNISAKVLKIIESDPEITQGTVKKLVNFLCSTLKHVNYEINYIHARLTIAAERALSTLVFAYAFKSKWDLKEHINTQSRLSNEGEKLRKKEYFLSAILKIQIARGNWDRKELRLNDRKTSNFFAIEFLEAVKRGVITDERTRVEQKFRDKRGTLSYKSILLQIEEQITKELETEPGKEIINQNDIIIQSICNRNEIVQREFNRKWEGLVENLSGEIFKNMKALFKKQLNRIQVKLTTILQILDKKNRELGETGFDSDSIFVLDDKQVESVEQARESLLKIAVIYLEMYLDPKVTPNRLQTFINNYFQVEGIKFVKKENACLCEKPINQSSLLDNETFKKLANTKMFNSVQIFNIHEYIREFKYTLDSYQFEVSRAKLEEIIKTLRDEYSSLVINCPSQCPSCGKFCEKEIHPHDGKCHIKTGHQICSMGGKVWKNDINRTAILFMCDDYKNDTLVQIPGQEMTWSKFKEKSGNEWDWTLPNDREYKALQENNREKMKKIWDKIGKGILNYHASKGVDIKYISYSEFNDSLRSTTYRICFVIDGTRSMHTEIHRTRVSVMQLISLYEHRGKQAVFKIVIYRDHCDGDKIIEQFPRGSSFTPDHCSIADFLNNIRVHGGGDVPEAVLDGLATATTKCDWTTPEGFTNIIIHIYDAPPHGNFPNYKSHSSNSNTGNCCCCNHGTRCKFDWDRDVWKKMHELDIKYNGISTGGKFDNFEAAMKSNLEKLCGDFQLVGKETVNDAILSIFIDYKMD